ncbi:hypothetical protein GH714_033000 [Hevea brasiliensis]|uniref:Uncharacterized protein n=1 Tax=Hevea brasiliensis TaxID=3981 RepID=A0A6A6L2D3_HEVBR|nr:hypothetical protein GH714_033000 [Hevea brasiliensis]
MESEGVEMEVENDEPDVEEASEGENDHVGNDTDYYDSKNEGSVEELSNDDGEVEIRQRKSKRVMYDPNYERPPFVLGMCFPIILNLRHVQDSGSHTKATCCK